MTISIIVPVYNAQKYLIDCINSVINQSEKNWELLLIDDGSTDDSGIICDKYDKQYTNIFAFHKENEGQFLTREFGIQKSTGEYIGFLDADDFLDNNFVKNLIDCIQCNGYPEVICFEYALWNETIIKKYLLSLNNQEIRFDDLESRKNVYCQMIDGTLTGSMWSKVFKSKLIKSSVVDSSIVRNKRFAEDTFQSFSVMANAKSIVYLKKLLYYYRDNAEGASQGFEYRDLDYYNKRYVYQFLAEQLPVWKMYEEDYINKLLAFNFNYTVYYILKYYRAAKTSKRRKDIVDHDWSTYLLEMTDKDLNNNPYVRKSYIKVWNAFKNKRHLEIFIREKIKKIGWG